jgi:hypothetical protein
VAHFTANIWRGAEEPPALLLPKLLPDVFCFLVARHAAQRFGSLV